MKKLLFLTAIFFSCRFVYGSTYSTVGPSGCVVLGLHSYSSDLSNPFTLSTVSTDNGNGTSTYSYQSYWYHVGWRVNGTNYTVWPPPPPSPVTNAPLSASNISYTVEGKYSNPLDFMIEPVVAFYDANGNEIDSVSLGPIPAGAVDYTTVAIDFPAGAVYSSLKGFRPSVSLNPDAQAMICTPSGFIKSDFLRVSSPSAQLSYFANGSDFFSDGVFASRLWADSNVISGAGLGVAGRTQAAQFRLGAAVEGDWNYLNQIVANGSTSAVHRATSADWLKQEQDQAVANALNYSSLGGSQVIQNSNGSVSVGTPTVVPTAGGASNVTITAGPGVSFEAPELADPSTLPMSSSASDLLSNPSGRKTFVSNWLGGFFHLNLPTSLGKSPIFSVPLGCQIAGVSELVVNFSSGSGGISAVRTCLAGIVYACGVLGALLIYKGTF